MKLLRLLTKALRQYRLIDDGDHVLVALSGGKDSLCLLQLLAQRRHVYPPRFSLSAVHVRMENVDYESDTSYLEDFCKRLDVPLYIRTTRFETTASNNEESATHSIEESATSNDENSAERTHIPHQQKTPCFLCSWNRRKQIFNLAQELGCTKIALGHHQDDILHTALMNLTFQGRFGSMPVLLRMKKMPLTIIRPLCLCREADIRAFAEEQHYQPQRKRCPYDTDTHRTSIRNLYNQMEALNPELRYSLWHALERDNKLIELS